MLDGAAVRVSIVDWGYSADATYTLDGNAVDGITPDLQAASSSKGVEITQAGRLSENLGIAFQGPVKVGAFDIDGETARAMLLARGNPNGRPNSDVLRPWANGADITRRPSDTWIIDFAEMPIDKASLYEARCGMC
ncbi:MAG: hypothetical protein ACREEP_02205 [Dongiaceae bacterium]